MKYVYMLRAGEEHYKVGIASNVYNRLKSIQTGNASKVSIVTTNLVREPSKLEGKIHKLMEEFKMDGGVEWFKLSKDRALDLAILINDSTSVDLSDFVTMQSLAKMQAYMLKEFSGIKRLAIEGAKIQSQDAQAKAPIPRTLIEPEADDPMLEQSIEIIRTERRASTSLFQRKLKIGYGRSSRIMDELENRGMIGSPDGNKPRKVLI